MCIIFTIIPEDILTVSTMTVYSFCVWTSERLVLGKWSIQAWLASFPGHIGALQALQGRQRELCGHLFQCRQWISCWLCVAQIKSEDLSERVESKFRSSTFQTFQLADVKKWCLIDIWYMCYWGKYSQFPILGINPHVSHGSLRLGMCLPFLQTTWSSSLDQIVKYRLGPAVFLSNDGPGKIFQERRVWLFLLSLEVWANRVFLGDACLQSKVTCF